LALSLGWRLDANGHLTDARLVQDGGQSLFLVSSLGRTVYGLRDNGEISWQLRTVGPVYALDTLDDGRVAAGDDAGHVTLVSTGGQTLWQVDLASRVTALRGGWQGGVLAGGWDERLTFLDEGGRVRWQASLTGPLGSITALPNLALAATLAGQVVAFDPAGAQEWLFDAGAPVTSLQTIGQDDRAGLLLGLQNGQLLALDPGGTPRWNLRLDSGGPIVHVAGLEREASPEIVAGTGGKEPQLALLSAEGQLLWRLPLPSPVTAITSLDLDGDGPLEILVGLRSGQIQAYDRQGRLRASVHAGLSVWGLLAGEDGSALVLADVAAWQLNPAPGASGGPWLRPPDLVQAPSVPLPAGVQPSKGEAILVFLGDVAPGRSMEYQLARYGPAYPWAGLGSLLQGADLAVANLESVLAWQGKPMDKSYLIRAHPLWGQTLVAAGFDLVTLANNHALDFGQAGLDGTLSTLRHLELATIGAGPSPEAARRPALFNLNGVRVAVLGYLATRWNGSVDVPVTDQLAWAEPAAVQADVAAIRDQVDLLVVLLHAGTEYATTPSSDQVAVAYAAIDAGADLVAGHHSHVTQTVERYKDGLIVYGLGDALFDIPRLATRQGDLLRVHATREGLTQVELWPFWIQDAIRPRLLDDGHGAPNFSIIYP
jgi:poly-gamma-glutamate synthesis protein (capsule biosynthesis protein)